MRVLGAIGLALVLAACAPEPPPTSIRESHPPTLATTSWSVVAVAGQGVAVQPEVSLRFDAAQVKGSGGCNDVAASYAYDPATGALAITDLVSTKRACTDLVAGRVESAYVAALRGASAASVDRDGRLVIEGSGPDLLLVVAGQPIGLPQQSQAGPS